MNRNQNPIRAKSLNRNTAGNAHSINMKEKQIFADRSYEQCNYNPFKVSIAPLLLSKKAPKQQNPSPFYQDQQLKMENSNDRNQKVKSSYDYQTPAGFQLKRYMQQDHKTDILNQQGGEVYFTRKEETSQKTRRDDNFLPAGFQLKSNSFHNGQTDIFNVKNQPNGYKADQGSNMQDPKFQKNLKNFFGVEEGSSKLNYQSQGNKPSMIPSQYQNVQNDPRFQKNLENFFGVDEGNSNNNNNRNNYKSNGSQQQVPAKIPNDAKFQKNLDNFFGVEKSQKKGAFQDSPQRDSGSRRYQQGMPPKIPNDPKFQKNLDAFFAVEDKPPVQQQSYVRNSNTYANAPKVPNDPKFQKNLDKFFAVEDGPQTRIRSTSYQQPPTQFAKEDSQSVKNSDSRTKLIPGAQYNNPITQEVDVSPGSGAGSSSSSGQRVVVLTEQNGSFIRQTEAYLGARGILDYEIFTLPGGALGLLNNDKWKQSFSEFLRWLGNVSTIILMASLVSEGSRTMLTVDKSISGMQEQLQQSKQAVSKFAGKCAILGVALDQKGVGVRVF